MELTTEQVLLLNNLMYMEGKSENSPLPQADLFEGQSIREWLSIDFSGLDDGKNYTDYTTGKEWNNIIDSVKADETLMNMKIATTHSDYAEGGGGGFSAVFVSEETQNAVVVFRGTEGQKEWIDNFAGRNVVETQQQVNALAWYQQVYKEHNLSGYEITVSGHSKGGNKSKYVTLLDDTVDHCVSFDGQGFSDKFMNYYADEIAANQGKIHNHNAEYDYVNILLNDVGEKTYYTGQDLEGFLANHCPNAFMKYDENGQFTLEASPNGQAKEMQAMDRFFNDFLRSVPENDRGQTLEMVNAFLQDGFKIMDEGGSVQGITDILKETITDPRYSDNLAYLIAYTIEYEQAHPEVMNDVQSVMGNFGMGEYAGYVDTAKELLNNGVEFSALEFTIHLEFDTLVKIASGISSIPGFSSDFIQGKVCDWIESNYGIRLTPDDLRSLLGILRMVNNDMQRIEIKDNGEDLEVRSTGNHSDDYGRPCRIKCNLPVMKRNAADLTRLQSLLSRASSEVETLANFLSFSLRSSPTIKKNLLAASASVRSVSASAGRLSQALLSCTEQYENSEIKSITLLVP